jgi:hypothetical protein
VVRYISPNLRTRHSGANFAPLEKLEGVITPNGLHFERHHAGVPQVDPKACRLAIHGMVERPLVFTLEDLKRFPSVTRTYFIERAGNGQNGYRNPPDPNLTATRSRGLASNASWTGVPLALLLKEAGVKPGAKRFIPEGMDAAMYTRSLPLEKAMEDVLVAYAQNGGYPFNRLVSEPFPITPDTEPVEYAIGNYWQYPTTLFDYIRRAMPFGQAGTLTDEEVYHLVAFLLYMNGIIDASTPVNQATLPKIRMPARELLHLDPETQRRFPWLTLP